MMPPMFVEKQGGLWPDGGPTTFELFDETRQLLGVVSTRGELFLATIHEQRVDPQWRLPVWGEHAPGSLFGSREEAIRYLRWTLGAGTSR